MAGLLSKYSARGGDIVMELCHKKSPACRDIAHLWVSMSENEKLLPNFRLERYICMPHRVVSILNTLIVKAPINVP